jgi:glutaredoxin
MSTRYLRLDDILRRLFFKERELVRNALSSLGVVKIVFDNVLLYPHCYPEVWFEDRVECYEGEEANKLLSDSFARSTASGASGSPTIKVNGESYVGGRQAVDFERAFCKAFGNEQPSSCASVPKPVAVELTVLNDETCGSDCDPTQIVDVSKQLFPGLSVKEVDVSSKEGKGLVEKYNIEIVPTYIFDDNVVKTESWKQDGFENNFKKLSDGSYALRNEVTGANYYIDPEVRAAKKEAMGINTADGKPDLDFFVMSYCPYGNQAEEIIKQVYDVIGDKVDFKPHYIYYANYRGGGDSFCFDKDSKYCSMHGVQEARQDVREECVLDKYGIGAWFDFATKMNSECSAQNADTCYENVASSLGYDLDYIKSCEATKANDYGAKNAELMSLFGAQGSPAIYVNGNTYAGGRDANSILKAVCDAFPDGQSPEECSSVIETTQSNSVPAGSCG